MTNSSMSPKMAGSEPMSPPRSRLRYSRAASPIVAAWTLSLSKPTLSGAPESTALSVWWVMSVSSDVCGRGVLGDAQVARAAGGDQLHDLAVGDVLGGDVGSHATQVERGDPVGDLQDVAHVVRDEHDTEAAVGQPADEVEDLSGL